MEYPREHVELYTRDQIEKLLEVEYKRGFKEGLKKAFELEDKTKA